MSDRVWPGKVLNELIGGSESSGLKLIMLIV